MRNIPSILALVLLLPGLPAWAADGTDKGASPVVLLFDEGSRDGLPSMEQHLSEFLGEGQPVVSVPLESLSEVWPESIIEIDERVTTECADKPVSTARWMKLSDETVQLAVDGKFQQARAKAEEAEAAWSCLDGVVTPTSLQQTALVRAWVALEARQSAEFEAALSQAAGIATSLPPTLVEFLPSDLQETFASVADDLPQRQTAEVVVSAEGAPIDAYVDGRVLGTLLGTGAQEVAQMDLAPGKHLVQIVSGDGGNTAFEIDVDDETCSFRSIERIEPEGVVQMARSVLTGGEVPPLLSGMLRRHPHTYTAEQVVLGRADGSGDQLRARMVPLARSDDGLYLVDDRVASRLTRVLDARSGDAAASLASGDGRCPEKTTPDRWHLRLGGSLGAVFVGRNVYAAPALELGIHSPWLFGLEIRPEMGITRSGFTYETDAGPEKQTLTYVTVGGSTFAAFRPRFKNLTLVLGAGITIRQPDLRFDSLRAHPTLEAGVGYRVGDETVLALHAEVTFARVYDAAIRISLIREISLGRKAPRTRLSHWSRPHDSRSPESVVEGGKP